MIITLFGLFGFIAFIFKILADSEPLLVTEAIKPLPWQGSTNRTATPHVNGTCMDGS